MSQFNLEWTIAAWRRQYDTRAPDSLATRVIIAGQGAEASRKPVPRTLSMGALWNPMGRMSMAGSTVGDPNTDQEGC